jgi:methyl-accepting chemotaxis protein
MNSLLRRCASLTNAGNLSIAARLHIGFGLVLLLLGAVGALSWYQTEQMAKQNRALVDIGAQRVAKAGDMQASVQSMVIALGAMCWMTDPEDIKLQQQDFTAALERYRGSKKAFEKLASSDVTKASPWRKPYQELTEVDEGAFVVFQQLVRDAATSEVPSRINLFFQSANGQAIMSTALAAMRVALVSEMEASARQADSAARTAQLVTACFVGLALCGGVFSAVWISRSISRPLGQAVSVARSVAKGDLVVEVPTDRKDEVGDLFLALAEMRDGLQHLVGDIRVCADSIQLASTEVASGNADLSQRTELAAGNLQQTSSSLEELTGAVRQSAESAHEANQLAISASTAAQRGSQVVEQVVSNMSEIAASSRKISDIIGVIDGIAFQTNLLALNAAVEAARAGEQGRGFAVVAGEVRNLAQRAAGAAREIKSLINNSVDRVESGARLVGDAGGSMAEIMAAVQRVTNVISVVTSAATEQSGGIGTVSGAVVQLDQMTQQNAALVEQSAAAAESLREQAVRLNSLVGTFRTASHARSSGEMALA